MSSVGDPSIPRNNQGCLRDAAIVGSVILALLLVVGIGASLMFFMTGSTLKQEDMAGLSESKVYADLEALGIPTPDLSGFAYVSSEGLSGPQFDDIDIGSIHYGSAKDGRTTPSTRKVTADAEWSNASVQVKRPLTAEFEFGGAEEGWRLSIYTLGEVHATPQRALNVYDLEGDVIPLLRLYDPALGEEFADALIRLDSNLWKTGGTVKATLTKTVEGEQKECVVTFAVSWSDERGWVVEVASVNGQASGTPPQGESTSATAPEPMPNGEDGAQILYCHEGDLVAITGELALKDGVFVLETPLTTVQMSGRTWTVERFVVTGPTTRLNESVGKNLTVNGYITAAYALDEAPLSLAMVSLS